MTTSAMFWIGVQGIVSGDQRTWVHGLESIRREFEAASEEVREQMQHDLESALSRLIEVDRALMPRVGA